MKPECTRKVTAAAAVKRPDGFKHTGTLVTLTLSEGDSFAKVNVRGLEKIDAQVTRPIAVTDDNADAALDPANDYVAPSTKAAAAS